MQGVQPTPNRKPSSGAAASPTAGTWWMRKSRWKNGTRPMNASPSRIVRMPSTTVELAGHCTSQLPTDPDTQPSSDEDGGEAEHEQQRRRPASGRGGPSLEVGAGQAGRVGEVAGQQRDHAGREERDQPGHQRDRDRRARSEPEAACCWNQSAMPAATSCTTSSIRCQRRRRHRADDARPRPGPGRRAPRCRAWRRGRARRGRRAAPRRPGRVERREATPNRALKALACAVPVSRMLMPTKSTLGRRARLGGVHEAGVSSRHGGAPRAPDR